LDFLVIGPGAIGCLFSARLTKAGHGVTIVDYREKRASFINNNGINLEGLSGEYTAHVPAITGEFTGRADVAMVCVKACQTREAAEKIVCWLHPRTVVLTLQNGLGNLEILEEIFKENRVFGGVTAEGSTLLGPGHVRHAGRGQTIIGPADSEKGHAEKIVSAFSMAGFDTRSTDEVRDLIWGKLIVNVGINALAAIAMLKNGQLPGIESAKAVMKDAVQEAMSVAHAKGIPLPYPDPFEHVLEVCRCTAENTASMLQDILREKTTEVGFINGAIVREGEALGIPTPVNCTLTRLVEVIQENYGKRIHA